MSDTEGDGARTILRWMQVRSLIASAAPKAQHEPPNRSEGHKTVNLEDKQKRTLQAD